MAGDNDSFIFGGKYGIGITSKYRGEVAMITRYWSKEEEEAGKPDKMRANDGAVDSRGRFWVSAVCDPEVIPFAPEGTYIMYCIAFSGADF